MSGLNMAVTNRIIKYMYVVIAYLTTLASN